ncbi:MAG: helix-turn-helix domain-containing protein [Eubacterium sp.]|nr:helix-turn-helix domain-containing protein [Eubacterium sp.]
MEINSNKMGFRIAQKRREMGIKQAVLAEAVGISDNHMSNIEKGYSTPSLETLIKICNALCVTPDYILLGSIRKDTAQNIIDDIMLCNYEDKIIIEKLIQVFVEKVTKK